MKKLVLFTAILSTFSQAQQTAGGQAAGQTATAPSGALAAGVQPGGGGASDQLLKRIDDVLWFTRLGDIAEVDKIEFTSSPPAHTPNPKAPGATNPLIIHAY